MAKGWLDNYNDSKVSLPEGFVGEGYNTKGRDYSPAWGGQFQSGGKLTFLQPTSDKLPQGYRIPYADPSSELAMSIGGEDGEPAYLIPSFKYGRPLENPIEEFKKTGEHLGGPFKTWQEADQWEQEVRHPYVEKGQAIPMPIKTWGEMAMGGSIPGSVGFTYARTQSPAPSNGPYAKKTKASAQNGETLQYGTPEYKKAYDENRVAYYDKDSDTYINQELAPIEVQGRVRDKGFWEQYVDKIVNENRGASPLEAAIGVPISAVSSLPQLAATYAFTDKVQRPSEAMDIENPYLAMGTDFVLDPLNATGTGVLTKERALARLAASKESGLLSNMHNLNPFAERLNNANSSYRVAGLDAAEDFVNTNILRSVAPVAPEGASLLERMQYGRTTGFPSFQKGYADMAYLPEEGGVIFKTDLPTYKRGEINPITGSKIKGRHYAHRVIDPSTGGAMREIPGENITMYGAKPHWWKGYQQIPKQEDGGVIKDDMGQWAHPGEITEIGSNQITMQGVPYPVLGISDTGDMQMMYPEEEYEFDGEKVTEFPMAKNGLRQEQKGLVNLDQLTNFTNYNKPQPGGWLNKYN